MRIWTITMQKEPSYSAGACSGSNSSQTRRWICHGKIGKTKGQCFRLCISCCRSPEKGKENILKFKKNLYLPHACTQGVGQLLPREQSCDMLAGWSGRDRPNARWWASGCSSEGRQQADLELGEEAVKRILTGPGKKGCGCTSKNSHIVGRQISHTLAFPMTHEQIVSNYFQGVCVNLK